MTVAKVQKSLALYASPSVVNETGSYSSPSVGKETGSYSSPYVIKNTGSSGVTHFHYHKSKPASSFFFFGGPSASSGRQDEKGDMIIAGLFLGLVFGVCGYGIFESVQGLKKAKKGLRRVKDLTEELNAIQNPKADPEVALKKSTKVFQHVKKHEIISLSLKTVLVTSAVLAVVGYFTIPWLLLAGVTATVAVSIFLLFNYKRWSEHSKEADTAFKAWKAYVVAAA